MAEEPKRLRIEILEPLTTKGTIVRLHYPNGSTHDATLPESQLKRLSEHADVTDPYRIISSAQRKDLGIEIIPGTVTERELKKRTFRSATLGEEQPDLLPRKAVEYRRTRQGKPDPARAPAMTGRDVDLLIESLGGAGTNRGAVKQKPRLWKIILRRWR